MIKVEYDDKKDLIKINDWQKESDMEEILTLLMILWDEVVLSSKGTITDEILFKEMKELSKLRLGGKEEKEVFEEYFTKASYTDLEKRINRVIEYINDGIEFPYYDEDTKKYFEEIKNILKGEDNDIKNK